jgi:uncharacterized protein
MAVRSKEDIFNVLEKHAQAIQAYGVHQYGLFGSFVRNEQQQDSDIDILVMSISWWSLCLAKRRLTTL